MGGGGQAIRAEVVLEARAAGMTATSSGAAMRRLHHPVEARPGVHEMIEAGASAYRSTCGQVGLCCTRLRGSMHCAIIAHRRLQQFMADNINAQALKSGVSAGKLGLVFHGNQPPTEEAHKAGAVASTVVMVCVIGWQCNQHPRHSVLLHLFTESSKDIDPTCEVGSLVFCRRTFNAQVPEVIVFFCLCDVSLHRWHPVLKPKVRMTHTSSAVAADLKGCCLETYYYAHEDVGFAFERSLSFCAECVRRQAV